MDKRVEECISDTLLPTHRRVRLLWSQAHKAGHGSSGVKLCKVGNPDCAQTSCCRTLGIDLGILIYLHCI